MNLTDRWERTWIDLALDIPGVEVMNALMDSYREPHRFYHTLHHLQECFELFDDFRHLATHPGEVQFALWFHDAVYDTRVTDNEDRSADIAERVLINAKAEDAQRHRVRDLILATQHDGVPVSNDACFVVDIDLAILGAPSKRFDDYEGQIRLEYSWVAETAFSCARRDILTQFLKRSTIYFTPQVRSRFEAQARANLERSLLQLGRTRT